MSSNHYEIRDMNEFAKSVGKEVAKDGGFTTDELKEYISVNNIKGIVKQYAKYSKISKRYYINEERTQLVCEDIYDWLNGVSLSKLAADGFLECWWDSDLNNMDFEEAKQQED